jgi:uncharacterized protein (UPF0335 family)
MTRRRQDIDGPFDPAGDSTATVEFPDGTVVPLDKLIAAQRATPAAGHNAQSVAADQLKALVERIERLDEERRKLGADIRVVYAEAKGNGFDGKALRRIVALRRQDAAKRAEDEAMLDLYKRALGMA